MLLDYVQVKVIEEFSKKYTHFKNFQEDEQYAEYWKLCIEAVTDIQVFSGIIFCNDLYQIPPTKTFLLYYHDQLLKFAPVTKGTIILDRFVKRGIGAFWGTVFKYALDYGENSSTNIRVTSKEKNNLSSASYFVREDNSKENLK